MRKTLLILIALAGPLFFTQAIQAATTPAIVHPTPPVVNKLATLTLKEAQQLAGRKFTLKEKLGFWFLKKQAQRAQKKGLEKTLLYKALHPKKSRAGDEGSQANASMTFGIAAMVLLILGLFIPYVIFVSPIAAIFAIVLGTIGQKKDAKDSRAKLGKLFGWISLGLFVLILIIALIALASWSWI